MMQIRNSLLVLLFAMFTPIIGMAVIVPITNAGFEDTTGQSTFNEFTFGEPNGWAIHDPMDIHPSTGLFTGTLLLPDGTDFFDSAAPEGQRVGILFNSTREGEGEYGLEQILATTLEANTDYQLSVEVGNIASGTATNGTFFNLDRFPGYRVDLLAGNTVIASDMNSITIPEGQFATSTVSFSSGAAHPLLGQALSIRLVNLNVIPAGFTQTTSPDLEVDFDDVRMESFSSVPEPTGAFVLCCVIFGLRLQRKRH